MSSGSRTTLIAILALIVGAAAGAGFGMMQVNEVTQKLVMSEQEKEQAQLSAARLRGTNEAATRKYAQELGRLVTAAGAIFVPPPATPPAPAEAVPGATPSPPAPAPLSEEAVKLLDHVRAMLAARDALRAPLNGVSGAMNSEFDALAAELGNPAPDIEKVKQAVEALKQNWPAKEKAMTDATRRLLAELGVVPASAGARPPAAPAAALPATPAPASPPPQPK